MRFLADENFPGGAVTALQARGHDIVWVRTAAPGSIDEDVLAWATREDRVLLTFDKDFGELACRVTRLVRCHSFPHTDAIGTTDRRYPRGQD